jgi:adenosylmethionine-8-amino-7-oxononanoate aminotransferase
MVVEPLVQGAAGMIPQPRGWLSQVAARLRAHGALLIADEVLTGFGRTGLGRRRELDLFACHKEGVQPDLMALAKGMTGGYLPLAATLTSQAVFDVFLGEYHEFKTFFHGHSFTANQLGCAAALASLDLLQERKARDHRRELECALRELLGELWVLESVGDIRQVGLMAGIELVKDWRRRSAFALRERAGMRVAEAMARRGVITRPIGNVLVLMPPYVTTLRQLRRMIGAMADAISEVIGVHAGR